MILVATAVLLAGFMLVSYGREAARIPADVVSGTGRYTVQNGDTLNWIADQYGVSVNALKSSNGLDSDRIVVGQVLTIPKSGLTSDKVEKDETVHITAPVGSARGPVSSDSGHYTVQYGDSLWMIAVKYGVPVNDLKEINGLGTDTVYPGQMLKIPAKSAPGSQKPAGHNSGLPLREILREKGISASNPGLVIRVRKTAHTLSVVSKDGVWLKTYHVELGDNGLGDKAVSGDHKTPEGTFYISQAMVLSPSDPYLGSRWTRLSYPNWEDAQRGLARGLIDLPAYDAIVAANNNGQPPPQWTALGGGVGIHGGSTSALGRDWTWGCVGLTNTDVEDFYNFVGVGTKVIIER